MKADRADEFLQLLLPIEAELQHFVRRMVWDENDLPDALNNGLLKAVANFDRYQRGASFKAWMLAILTGEIFTLNRRYHRIASREFQMEPEEIEALPAPSEAPLAETAPGALSGVEDQMDEALSEALKSLSDAERAVLLLRSLQGFKYREISETLNMPIGSVMAYLSRARHKMRLLLQRRGWTQKENKP